MEAIGWIYVGGAIANGARVCVSLYNHRRHLDEAVVELSRANGADPESPILLHRIASKLGVAIGFGLSAFMIVAMWPYDIVRDIER
jgi:hypothetical protein